MGTVSHRLFAGIRASSGHADGGLWQHSFRDLDARIEVGTPLQA